jgi:hypothetical protein
MDKYRPASRVSVFDTNRWDTRVILAKLAALISVFLVEYVFTEAMALTLVTIILVIIIGVIVYYSIASIAS